MLGELLFQKLRTVQRLERVIDEIKIKRSPDDSALRDFDLLWSRLQEFLVEEREDANAKSKSQENNQRSTGSEANPKALVADPQANPKSKGEKGKGKVVAFMVTLANTRMSRLVSLRVPIRKRKTKIARQKLKQRLMLKRNHQCCNSCPVSSVASFDFS